MRPEAPHVSMARSSSRRLTLNRCAAADGLESCNLLRRACGGSRVQRRSIARPPLFTRLLRAVLQPGRVSRGGTALATHWASANLRMELHSLLEVPGSQTVAGTGM